MKSNIQIKANNGCYQNFDNPFKKYFQRMSNIFSELGR